MQSTGLKFCAACQTNKPVGAFSIDSSKKDGRCSSCKECAKTRTAQWILKNREAKRIADAKCHVRRYGSNPDGERNRRAMWRAKSPTYFRQYLEDNRGAHNARVALRDALKIQATPSWANRTAIAALYDQARKITIETGVPHEVDHAIPLRSRHVCGLHCEANLRIITKAENRSKRNLHWPDTPKGI